jgi:hypothetical protein
MHRYTRDVLTICFCGLIALSIVALAIMHTIVSQQDDSACHKLAKPFVSQVVNKKCYRLDENDILIYVPEVEERGR